MNGAAAVRYMWHNKVGVTVSPFSITGSRNFNLYQGNGRPDSNGIMGQIDFTPWGAGNSPLGPEVQCADGRPVHALRQIQRPAAQL